MKRYLWLVLMVIGLSLGDAVFADEVAQKTDGSFVGDDKSFTGGDIQKKTDGDFVGDNTIQEQNTEFSGDSYQQQVGSSTQAPFAQDGSQIPKDGVFIGQDTQKKTDGSFAGDDYGK